MSALLVLSIQGFEPEFNNVTGYRSMSLKIKSGTLEYGTKYMVSLSATINGTAHGPAYYQFVTNRPPQGGHCKVIPYNEGLDPMNDKQLVDMETNNGKEK